MRTPEILPYIGKSIVLGLAIAFIVIIVWPSLVGNNMTNRTVNIQQAAPVDTMPMAGPASYATAVEKAAPAVVNINTAKLVKVKRHPFFDDPVFRQFFGRQSNGIIGPQKRVVTSLGSGVIMSQQGFILTNHHVVNGADTIQVSLRDGRIAPASVIGTDPETDLAVLKIALDDLPAITIGHSDQLRVGDVALAIGNPFGVGQSVTMGIVGATGRSKLGINTFENFIQTDAAINPGNSGGALIDARGNLVGINTAIYSKSGGSQGIGFAIPTSLAQVVLQDIIQHGRPVRGWLGIEGDPVTPEIARSLKLKTRDGIVVAGILRDGPAHKAGVEPGDVIVAIDGTRITNAHQALMAISSHRPGSELALTVIRNQKSIDLKATVIERPAKKPDLK